MNESALSTAKGKYIVNLHTKEKCQVIMGGGSERKKNLF